MDAPREVWILAAHGNLHAFESDPREVHDSGKPVHRYVRADLAPSAQPAESSARVRRLAEALTRSWHLMSCRNLSDDGCAECQAINQGEWLDKALCEARAGLASPEAPRGSLADACAELARLQEPVAPEIQATLDSLPVLDLASIGPEAPRDNQIYPCAACGVMRSKAEGGTTFTVCDECWDKAHPKIAPEAPAKLQHVIERHANCQIDRCPICDGGLSVCTVCGRAEAELVPSCPGARVVRR